MDETKSRNNSNSDARIKIIGCLVRQANRQIDGHTYGEMWNRHGACLKIKSALKHEKDIST